MKTGTFERIYTDFVENVRTQFINSDVLIQNVQSQTAGVYENLADKLPRIIEQIDSSSNEARALVNYFITADDKQYGVSIVGKELEQARNKLREASKSIHEMRSVDLTLFRRIQEQVNQIETIHGSITSISKISDDIELLSYNSGFVASRAGVSGAAFTYIAAEIKKLSNRTKKLVNRMRTSTDGLINSYREFNQAIEKINDETDSKLDGIDENLATIFERYHDSLKNIASLLEQSLRRSEDAKKSVFSVMTALQDQDIIRQSLEQVTSLNNRFSKETELAYQSMALDSIPEVHRLEIAEQATAKLILMTQIADPMIKGIIENLENSLKKLVSFLNIFHAEVQDIENDRGALVDFFANAQSDLGDRSSIDLIFDESGNVMQELIYFIKQSISKKRDASDLGNCLIQFMNTTESCFEEMQDIVKAFSLIKVASKMEIAREQELSKNITTSSEMFEELTNKMEEMIVQLRRQLVAANQSIHESLQTLNDNLTLQEENVEQVSAKIEVSSQNLENMRINLNQAVRSVGKESTALFKLIDDSLDGAGKLQKMAETSGQLSSNYESVRNLAETVRRHGAQFYPVIFNKTPSFDRFDDIKKVVEKFAVYSDKYIAKQTMELEMEEGSAGGDLTLF